MSAAVMVVTALAGGGGAVARFFVDGVVRRSALPWATIVINLSGSFLLGSLFGASAAFFAPSVWVQILGVGFLGGYTTFSTASFETMTLLRQRKVGAALWNAFGVLIAATLLAALGYWLGCSLGASVSG